MRLIILCAAIAAAVPARAAVTPADATGIETQLKAWMQATLGPKVKLGDRPVEVTPEGDAYRVKLPIRLDDGPKRQTLDMTALARPAAGGTWAIEQIRMPFPASFTIEVTPPAKEGDKKPPAPMQLHYTVSAASQEGQGVWDPAYATPSVITQTVTGLDVKTIGPGLQQTSHFDKSVSSTTIKPAVAGRVDVVSEATGEGYTLLSKTADTELLKLAIQKVRLSSTLDGVSRERGPELMQALVAMATEVVAQMPKPGAPAGAAKPPQLSPATAAALAHALQDVVSDMTLDESAEGVQVTYAGMTGGAGKARLGMGGQTVKGLLQAHMDVAVDDLAFPDFGLGPMQAFLPKRVEFRPVIGGVATQDLLDLIAAPRQPDGTPSPAVMAKLFSHGGVTTGLESFAIELGGTAFTGNVQALIPSGKPPSGTAQVTATDFDAVLNRVKAVPSLAQVLPALVFAKGIGRNVGDKVVWDVTYLGGKLLVNGTDLSAMTR